MKNELVLQADRFEKMKEVIKFRADFVDFVKEKDAEDLYHFAVSGFNNGQMYLNDVMNLYWAVKGEEHGEINRYNVLSCIFRFESWVRGMIDYFENFNN